MLTDHYLNPARDSFKRKSSRDSSDAVPLRKSRNRPKTLNTDDSRVAETFDTPLLDPEDQEVIDLIDEITEWERREKGVAA